MVIHSYNVDGTSRFCTASGIYIGYNIIVLAAYADYMRLYFLFYSSDSATIIQPESYDLFTDINYSVNTLDLNN